MQANAEGFYGLTAENLMSEDSRLKLQVREEWTLTFVAGFDCCGQRSAPRRQLSLSHSALPPFAPP